MGNSTVDSGGNGEIDNGTSIAIDSNDAKHIVYYDDENGDLRMLTKILTQIFGKIML